MAHSSLSRVIAGLPIIGRARAALLFLMNSRRQGTGCRAVHQPPLGTPLSRPPARHFPMHRQFPCCPFPTFTKEARSHLSQPPLQLEEKPVTEVPIIRLLVPDFALEAVTGHNGSILNQLPWTAGAHGSVKSAGAGIARSVGPPFGTVILPLRQFCNVSSGTVLGAASRSIHCPVLFLIAALTTEYVLGGIKQRKFTLSQFWRPEVQN